MLLEQRQKVADSAEFASCHRYGVVTSDAIIMVHVLWVGNGHDRRWADKHCLDVGKLGIINKWTQLSSGVCHAHQLATGLKGGG